jgi:hypothetical protein
LLLPELFKLNAKIPIAVLLKPEVLFSKDSKPIEVLFPPVTFKLKALCPTAVLLAPVDNFKA